MWWLLALLGILSITIIQCAKERDTKHASSKSKKKGSSSKSKSGRSSKSKSRKRKSGKSGKSSRKSSKSGRKSSSKSGRSSKSSKSSKNKKPSAKSATGSEKSGRNSQKKSGSNGRNSQKKSGSKGPVQQPQAAAADAACRAEQRASDSARNVENTQKTLRPVEVRSIDMRTEPQELAYQINGGLKMIRVHNNTNERRAFKVKCSDNQLYRVNPVFGTVEPGKSAQVEILRQNGAAKTDKIVLVTAPLGEVNDVREAFARGGDGQHEMMVVPLTVQE